MANTNHVFGIFEVPQGAEVAVDELLSTDFDAWAITVMFRDNEDSRNFARWKNTKPPLGTYNGKMADQPLDGSWGLLDPGAGPSEGALPGALAEMGIPAEWSAGTVLDGKVLVSVECANPDRARQATEVLRAAGAKNTGSSVMPASKMASSASAA
jgi:hypothetical protein